MWDKWVMDFISVVVGSYSVSFLLRNVEDGFNWVLSGGYDPNDDRLRGNMWEELRHVTQKCEVVLCVIGDFQ